MVWTAAMVAVGAMAAMAVMERRVFMPQAVHSTASQDLDAAGTAEMEVVEKMEVVGPTVEMPPTFSFAAQQNSLRNRTTSGCIALEANQAREVPEVSAGGPVDLGKKAVSMDGARHQVAWAALERPVTTMEPEVSMQLKSAVTGKFSRLSFGRVIGIHSPARAD